MRFLSLVASARRRGNSEALGQIALSEALKSGAEDGELVHLERFRIEQCNGCMRCVFKGETCPLDDDIYEFLEKIVQADALFLTAPTYVLSVPGSLKLVMDRFLLTPNYFDRLYGRPAASVGVAGLPHWGQFQLPLMNLFLLSMGFRVVESFMAYAPGPGEVLLDEQMVSRVQKAARQLCDLSKEGSEKKLKGQILPHCPVCFSTLFERVGEGRFRCPVCLIGAEERKEGFYFSAESMNHHRWTREKVKEHFENWILKTGEAFLARRDQIKKRRKELKLS